MSVFQIEKSNFGDLSIKRNGVVDAVIPQVHEVVNTGLNIIRINNYHIPVRHVDLVFGNAFNSKQADAKKKLIDLLKDFMNRDAYVRKNSATHSIIEEKYEEDKTIEIKKNRYTDQEHQVEYDVYDGGENDIT